jgi:hypothetical protein
MDGNGVFEPDVFYPRDPGFQKHSVDGWQMSQTVRCWQGKKGVSWLRFGPHAGGLGRDQRDQRDQNRKRWN